MSIKKNISRHFVVYDINVLEQLTTPDCRAILPFLFVKVW